MSILRKYKYFSSFEAGNCVSNSSFNEWKIEANNSAAEGLRDDFFLNSRIWTILAPCDKFDLKYMAFIGSWMMIISDYSVQHLYVCSFSVPPS